MDAHDKVNILMVDDQPAKLLSYEVILRELGENLIQPYRAEKPWRTCSTPTSPWSLWMSICRRSTALSWLR